jgi:hypothetical protein
MTQRKVISEQISNFPAYTFEGTLSSVLERVQELVKIHGPDARLDYNQYFHYEYDNYPTPRYELYIDRVENDAEVKQRLFEQAEQIRKREESDKAEFERLSKKFGSQL